MRVRRSATEVAVRPRTPMERVRFGSMSMWVRLSLTLTSGPLSPPSFRFAVASACRRRFSCIRAAAGIATGLSTRRSRRTRGSLSPKRLSKPLREPVYKPTPPAPRTWHPSYALPAHRTTSEIYRLLSYLGIESAIPSRFNGLRYVSAFGQRLPTTPNLKSTR